MVDEARRKFLTVAGSAALTGLAGCSEIGGSSDGNGGTPLGEADTQTSEPATQQNEGSETTETEQNTTAADQNYNDENWPQEDRYDSIFDQEGGNFWYVETEQPGEDISLPDNAENFEREFDDRDYESLVARAYHVFDRDAPNDQEAFIFAVSDEVNADNGEPLENNDEYGVSLLYFGPEQEYLSDHNASKKEAVERFFREDISDIDDATENAPQDMIEYAES